MAVENKDILYIGSGANVLKSVNGAWFFELPVSSAVGPVWHISMAPSYPEIPVPGHVLVGGVLGGVSRSTNAAASFAPVLAAIPGATFVRVIGDIDYANNNTLYAGSFTVTPAGGQGVFRYEVGVSSAWEAIDPGTWWVGPNGVLDVPPGAIDDAVAAVTGLWMNEGVLYAAVFDPVGVNSGVERSLLPDIPIIATWQWEQMQIGSAGRAFFLLPFSLRGARSDDTISLWVIDVVAPGTLVCYDDTMALTRAEVTVPAEVPIDSVTGRNQQFTISWAQPSNAIGYDAEIYTDPACTALVIRIGPTAIRPLPLALAPPPPWWTPPNPLNPAWVVPANTLVAGQEYFFRLRARDQIPRDMIRAPYSSVHRFEVQGGERVEVSYLGVQPLGPACGSISNPLSPGFSWSPYAKSTRYEFQLASDAGFTDILAEAKVSATGYMYDGKLSTNTTYFWRVRAIEPTTTDWSPVCSFTTEKEPPPPPPPPVEVVTPPPPEPVVTAPVIWAIIGIGAILVIAVIVLIVRTRRVT
jgi:hypothetical protein